MTALSASSATSGPLHRIRILDLTQFLSGPFCTQILGDLGADVLKVEAPEGDISRHLPPHYIGGESVYFHSTNRNKRSIVVDLKTEDGRRTAGELIRTVDVVVENYRPGVLKRLGLDREAIMRQVPSLVWCSITGFGENGPYRDRPAYDMVVQAMSGAMSLTGEEGGAPVRSGIPMADLAAGMYGVIGIQAAIEERRESGLGQHVDIAMLDTHVALLNYQAAYYLNSQVVPGRQGRGHDSIPTYRAFTASDARELVVTANTERMWRAMCGVLDLEELVTDERFVTNVDRYRHRDQLWPILEERFRQRDADEWLTELVKMEVPAAIVNNLEEVFQDPQVLHREMVLDLVSEEGEVVRVAGDPIRFSRTNRAVPLFPPPHGRDTAAVIESLLGEGEPGRPDA